MPDTKVHGEVNKSDMTKIIVTEQEWGGRTRIHIREWYKGEDEAWRPTKKGVTIKKEDFPELLKVLKAVK